MYDEFLRFAEHLEGDCFDPIPEGELGTYASPYKVAPPDWKEEGVPYGAWCRCSRCNNLGRSTYAFDFYAIEPGDNLVCETCVRIDWAKK